MVFTAAVVFGFFSYQRLPVRLMPELNYPTLTVRTEFPGAAPEEVENEVSRPIEESLGVIGGLKEVSSVSRAGISDVTLEFLWGTDMSEATQDTLEKLDLVVLPEEAESPLILHYDPSLDPILELSFSGTGVRYEGEQGLRRLRRIAELQIKRHLEPVPGVAAVRIRGGLEEEIHVLIDATKLQRSNLSIQEVIERLRQENINVAGGTIQEGKAEYMVRTLNEYTNLQQIEDTVLFIRNNREVRVNDIGEVKRSHREREIITRTDGSESVQIDIYKEAEANIVEVANRIRDVLGEVHDESRAESKPALGFRLGPAPRQESERLAARLDREEGAKLRVVADRSTFIENSIKEVRNTALLGGSLAVIVLFLFLHQVRTTLIVAVSIPMSLLITFAPLNLLSVSLNIMSLGGLALGIGMLVDSSIVVIESIFRCREEGDDLHTAAIRGTREVRSAVVASTLTSIAVFFPMVFVEGIAGQAFSDLGLAVVISLLASLAVAVFFIPMLASRNFRPLDATFSAGSMFRFRFTCWDRFQEKRRSLTSWRKWIWYPYALLHLTVSFLLEVLEKTLRLAASGILFLIGRLLLPGIRWIGGAVFWYPLKATGWLIERLAHWYPRLLKTSLRHGGVTLVAMAAIAAATWQLATRLPTELLPEVHQGEFTFEVNLPVGTPLEKTQQVLQLVEQTILETKGPIERLLVTYGYDVTNVQRSDEGEHTAKFKVVLDANSDLEQTEQKVIGRLRELFSNVPDADVQVTRPVLFSTKKPIEVEIHGDDLNVLKRKSAETASLLAELPELADVESLLKSGAPEIQIVYDRERLTRYGMNVEEVATKVRNLVKGYEATQFNRKDRRIPILVRLEESRRRFVEDIRNIVVNPQADQPIPLYAIAELELGEGPSEVRRIDGQRVGLIQSNVGAGSLGNAVQAIDRTLSSEMDWPESLRYFITGQNEEWQRSETSLYLALALSLFLVYVIMAAQFESLLQPFIIMLTIPLAFFGTVAGLWLLKIPVSIVVFLGAIMLAGIVVNNAIVLVDYANQLQLRGESVVQAIVSAGSIRLRPILMTTLTTVLGLLPMALGLGEGAEIRTPMALAVITGLICSTVLTLVFIPTTYYLVETAKQRLLHRRSSAMGTGAAQGSTSTPL